MAQPKIPVVGNRKDGGCRTVDRSGRPTVQQPPFLIRKKKRGVSLLFVGGLLSGFPIPLKGVL